MTMVDIKTILDGSFVWCFGTDAHAVHATRQGAWARKYYAAQQGTLGYCEATNPQKSQKTPQPQMPQKQDRAQSAPAQKTSETLTPTESIEPVQASEPIKRIEPLEVEAEEVQSPSSYAVCVATFEGLPLKKMQIHAELEKLWEFAEQSPDKLFLMAPLGEGFGYLNADFKDLMIKKPKNIWGCARYSRFDEPGVMHLGLIGTENTPCARIEDDLYRYIQQYTTDLNELYLYTLEPQSPTDQQQLEQALGGLRARLSQDFNLALKRLVYIAQSDRFASHSKASSIGALGILCAQAFHFKDPRDSSSALIEDKLTAQGVWVTCQTVVKDIHSQNGTGT